MVGFQMAFSWLVTGGDPNHLRTGMILQVSTAFSSSGVCLMAENTLGMQGPWDV